MMLGRLIETPRIMPKINAINIPMATKASSVMAVFSLLLQS